MCSGITSASTASNAFAGFLSDGFGLGFDAGSTGRLVLALGFMALVAAINLRGVGESVKANVRAHHASSSPGLLMIILIGFWAMSQGRADFSEVMVFRSSEEKSAFLALTAATSLAFFAMVGFEDSVNMAEECTNPVRDFPRMMLTGLGITGLIYVLVSICAVALVPVGDLVDTSKGSALTQVVRAGAPGPPLRPHLPLHRHVRGGQLRAHQHADGEPPPLRPRPPGRAAARRSAPSIRSAAPPGSRSSSPPPSPSASSTSSSRNSQAQAIALLGGTTALLLLCVFTVVNIALIVLRRRPPVGHEHFRTPGFLPWIGAATCAYLVGPWARSAAQMPQYRIAAWLLAIGLVLWALTWAWNRAVRHRPTRLAHPEELARARGRRADQLRAAVLDPRRRLRHNGRERGPARMPMGLKTFLLKFFTWWNGQTFGTQLFTWRHGKRVGEDAEGNVFYQNADGVAALGDLQRRGRGEPGLARVARLAAPHLPGAADQGAAAAQALGEALRAEHDRHRARLPPARQHPRRQRAGAAGLRGLGAGIGSARWPTASPRR